MPNKIILNVGRPNFSCEYVSVNTFFFSFTIKLLCCQKSRTFKFVYLQNNLYHQKDHKNYIKDIIMVTLVFQAVFELLLLKNGKKS